MRELALFAGAGGGLLASRLLGFQTVGAVEIEPFCREVLRARQADGMLEEFPIYEDVTTFDPEPWMGKVDIVTGGFPCQNISKAGRGEGLHGQKSSLWWDMWRIAGDVGAGFIFLENAPELTSRGLGDILGAMAERGWNAEWIVLGAGHVGAPHIRQRIWLLACDPNRSSQPAQPRDAEVAIVPKVGGVVPDADCPRRQVRWQPLRGAQTSSQWCHRWPAEPRVGRVVDGLAESRLDRRARLKALGNGQVPRVAAAAFSILWERLMRDSHGRD
jgi:DNA (cytosine-5)-methyltransferase 1